MLRRNWLGGVAICCLLTASAAMASDKRLVAEPAPMPTYGPIQPFYGSINPFYGSINPFYGSINPFYGSISPFWGDITPFWGDITPFYGPINPFYGTIDPFWGDISPFYGSINPFYGTIQPFWTAAGPEWGAINAAWTAAQASPSGDYGAVQSQMQGFLTTSANFWGDAVHKATGKDFMTGFAAPMLAKYGIDVNDPSSFANVDAVTRSAFFLNWYDGLMNFSGTDHVDWWMPAVHWSPLLTQIQGLGTNSVIGVLDSTFSTNGSDVDSITVAGGYKAYVNDHGAAVASLIAAQHDGHGVMGIAPNSDIELYNPFDATGTASWSDVATGINTLSNKGAHVVNASLGVPGQVLSAEWGNIISGPLLSPKKNQLVIVKAAGNEGVTQTANVPWVGLDAPQNLILVGSVGPTGQISSFSNTPGEACITTLLGLCFEQNKLKYRFIVAPGELMLVSDNQGGVTRMSGTSFAAPLVTGAVALLQDRWPWLQQHAAETVQIILQSATDLGAPGVDPVYGWGELNVEASQSPLDFDNLVVYQPFTYKAGGNNNAQTGILPNWSAHSLKSAVLQPGQLALWQQQSAYVVAFEYIGTTYRDFTIPLSTLLAGGSQKVNGTSNPFQSYLYQRLIDWAHGNDAVGFNAQAIPLDRGDWNLSLVATQSTADEARRGEGPFHSEFVATNAQAGVTLKLGEGNGAHSLLAMSGFDARSDFDPSTGGVNPVLGFASGGAYASGAFALGGGAVLNFGVTQKAEGHSYIDPNDNQLRELPLDTARAMASVVGVDYTVTKGLTAHIAYTHLNEANGLLGAQGSGVFTLPGAATDATTVGWTVSLDDGFALAASATAARTTTNAGGALTLAQPSLQSTAYELVTSKTGVFGDTDSLRLSFAQPLHVEGGALQYHSLEVIDRQTGAVGPVTQTWNLGANREYRVETMYATPILEGRGEIAGFSLLDINPPALNGTSVSVSVGAQLRFDF